MEIYQKKKPNDEDNLLLSTRNVTEKKAWGRTNCPPENKLSIATKDSKKRLIYMTSLD